MEGVSYISGNNINNNIQSIDCKSSPSASPRSQSDNIFNLKFSELPSSRYSYFLHGFKDEDDFEEFKKDLYNFKKLKQNCNNNNLDQESNNKTPDDSDNELSDDLEIICRPNRTRRRTLCSQSDDCGSRRTSGELKAVDNPAQHSSCGLSSAQSDNQKSESLEVPKPDSNLNIIPNRESPRLHRRSVGQRKFCLRPESFGIRGDLDRRSGLFVGGYDRRSGLRSSINDLLMEFIDGDEHFREFERVYDTINNKRRSRDLNSNSLGRMSLTSRNASSPRLPGSVNGRSCVDNSTTNQPEMYTSSASTFVDDTFADFFDNDEDFLEFEKEFEKIRSNRLSRIFSSGSSFGSSKDIFGDLKAYCDRNSSRSNTGSSVSVSSCSSQSEAEPGCGTDENENGDLIWRSEEDWGRMLKKMRRNSRLVMEKRRNSLNRDCNHRHSLYGLSSGSGVDDRYQKTQSLADLSVCCKEDDSNIPPPPSTPLADGDANTNEQKSSNSRTDSSADIGGVSDRRKPGPPHQDSFSGFSSYEGDNCSVDDAWSDSCVGLYDDDVRYSSSSTLCSSHNNDDDDDNDLSLSLSCSCSSDLHIDEDTDEDFNFPPPDSPTCRQRSHSLMELSDRHREERKRRRRPQHFLDPPFHSGSLMNMSTTSGPLSSNSCQDYDIINMNDEHNQNFKSSSSSTLSQSPSSDSLLNSKYLEEGGGDSLRHNQQQQKAVIKRDNSISLESHTTGSDTDGSDKYHSAKSDFSDRFHSAKSDMPSTSSVYRRSVSSCDASSAGRDGDDFQHRQGMRPNDRSLSLNAMAVEGGGCSRCRMSSSDDMANGCNRVNEWLNQTSNHRHSADCHLTSHEHCVSSVTLDCITVSEDAGPSGNNSPEGLPVPRTTAAPNEPSLSLGQLSTRPGCAKSVSTTVSDNASTTAATTNASHHHHHQQQQQVHQYQQNTAPKSQTMSRTRSLPECHHHHSPDQLPHHPLQQNHVQQSQEPKGDNYKYQRHSSSPCLQGLPPPPSAIDELTQGNDDARFITSSHQAHHHHQSPPPPSSTNTAAGPSHPHPPLQQSPSIPPTIQECPPGPATHAPHHAQTTMTISHDVAPSSSLSVKLEGEAEEKDETDSGYRSGTIPDDKLPKVPSQATLDRQELKRKITKYNHFVPAASFEMTGKNSFQGFIKVTMNLIRPITMELGARPPSIYELLTREHIIEENTQQVAFYMPRDTHKSLHIDNDTTTREVISSLLKKFHILDHPRKFAMYEQEFNDKNKLVRLRRLADKNHPLEAALAWDPERIKDYRMVLQENETGEIVWDAFSLPELGNFLKVLDREERETIQELRHKYKYMRQIMDKRLTEFKTGKILAKSKSSDC